MINAGLYYPKCAKLLINYPFSVKLIANKESGVSCLKLEMASLLFLPAYTIQIQTYGCDWFVSITWFIRGECHQIFSKIDSKRKNIMIKMLHFVKTFRYPTLSEGRPPVTMPAREDYARTFRQAVEESCLDPSSLWHHKSLKYSIAWKLSETRNKRHNVISFFL